MHAHTRWTSLCIWLAVSCIAAMSCLLSRPAAHIGAEYFPVGNDSFYHARRILDTVRDPASFYQFDPKIHAPEGSLLVWPWGYDYAIAKIVRAGAALGLGEPLMIMLWIPVIAVFAGCGLLILVARRLSLGQWAVALGGLCMALNATTQVLYGFGQIDHHYAEHLFLLASLAGGLAWFRTPDTLTAIALGAVLGFALGAHNALFILQLPLLATALIYWLQGRRAPLRPTIALISALLVSGLAMLVPSLPFQQGRFEFYTLSWFHLYVLCCTALTLVLFSLLRPGRRSIAVLVATVTLLLLPLLRQIAHAQSFVVGSLGMLDQILEMRSPLSLLFGDGFTEVIGFYSVLVLLAPVTFVLCLSRIWRERDSPRLLFWVTCVFGLSLLAMQLRMHYFGSFALYLPWLVVIHDYATRRVELAKRIFLITSLGLVLAFSPVIRYALIAPVPHGGDDWFVHLYPIFPALREACAEDPGVVLSDSNAGHYIRYFSDCSVIADNFLLTEQQFQKADEVGRLFSLSASKLTTQAPFVKYVLVRAGKVTPGENGHFSYEFFGSYPPDSSRALLLGSQTQLPPQYRLLYTVDMQMRQNDEVLRAPYAKLYKIEPAATDAPSANDVGE